MGDNRSWWGRNSARPSRTAGPRAGAGLLASLLFVASFTVNGALTKGYQPRSRFVSELALTRHGWVQDATFLGCGVLLVVFSGCLIHPTGPTRATWSRVATVAMALAGLGLGASAFFATDRSDDTAVTGHGWVHSVLGAVFFSSATVAVLATGMNRHRVRHLMVGALLVFGLGLLKWSQVAGTLLYPDRGIVQRSVLVVIFTWVAVVSLTVMVVGLDKGADSG